MGIGGRFEERGLRIEKRRVRVADLRSWIAFEGSMTSDE